MRKYLNYSETIILWYVDSGATNHYVNTYFFFKLDKVLKNSTKVKTPVHNEISGTKVGVMVARNRITNKTFEFKYILHQTSVIICYR